MSDRPIRRTQKPTQVSPDDVPKASEATDEPPPKPIRRVAKPEPGDARKLLKNSLYGTFEKPGCPACKSGLIEFLSCVGTLPEPGTGKAELVSTRICKECSHRWETRTPRSDVCDHGRMDRVPCEPCGRTWETIEAALAQGRRPDHRPGFDDVLV